MILWLHFSLYCENHYIFYALVLFSSLGWCLWLATCPIGCPSPIQRDKNYHGLVITFLGLPGNSQKKKIEIGIELQYCINRLYAFCRSGHTVTLETASPQNQRTRYLYVVGGTDGSGGDGAGKKSGNFLNDVWYAVEN